MAGNTFTVTRSTSIDAPPERVYRHVIDFHNWESWSPWEELDPAMDKTYSGPDSGVGSRYAWSGNRRAGVGSMEITDASEPTSVTIALDFLKPFKSSNTTSFTLHPQGEGTEVTWKMTGPMTLGARVLGIFKSMDSMVGPDFEKGLDRLKTVAEGR